MAKFCVICKSKTRKRPPTKLEKLADKYATSVSVSLFDGIKRLRKKVSNKKIQEAIKNKQIGKIMQEIPWEETNKILVPAFDGVKKVFNGTAKISMEALPSNVNENLRMDLSNPNYTRFIDERISKFLIDMDTEVQNVVLSQIQLSFSHAKPIKEVADDIVDHIGLNARQSAALYKYKERLKQSNMTKAEIEQKVDDYNDRLLNQRAIMIARTEIQNANNLGQNAVWQQAANEGLIDPATSRKKWLADRNPCEDCAKMNGTIIKFEEQWTFPDGRKLNVPSESHPNCRCMSDIVLD